MNVEVQIKKGRKFDQVLEGAKQVFLADGYEGASVDDIARAAQVSKATLYSYFPDKRLLFIEVAKRECARQAEIAVAQVHMEGALDEVLFRSASTMVRFFISDLGRQTYRMAVAESARFPEIGRAFWEGGPTIARDALVCYLREQVQKGALMAEDVDLAADQFIELCKSQHHVQAILGVKTQWSDAEIDHIIHGAVETFLARYAATPQG